jgi:septal ring factor EnvC (AmiA/AmiB activator)
MKPSRELLRAQLERYETELKGFKSYLKELNDMTARHSTDRAHFEEDLIEAENNVKYYEGEVAEIKKEIGDYDKSSSRQGAPDSVLPRTVKQGIGSFVLSSVSFVAGALLGSKMKARQTSRDAPMNEKKKD